MTFAGKIEETEKLLILSIMISFAINSVITVYNNVSVYGFNPTYLTGNNFAESMGLIRKSIV